MKLSLRHLPADALRVFGTNVALPLDLAANLAIAKTAKKATSVVVAPVYSLMGIDGHKVVDAQFGPVTTARFYLDIYSDLIDERFQIHPNKYLTGDEVGDRSIKAGLLFLADLLGLTPLSWEISLEQGMEAFTRANAVTSSLLDGLDEDDDEDDAPLTPEAFARWMETGEFDLTPISDLVKDPIK